MPWIDLTKISEDNPDTKKETNQILEYRRRNAKARFYADENFPFQQFRYCDGIVRAWSRLRKLVLTDIQTKIM